MREALMLALSVMFPIVCVISLGSPRVILFPGDSQWFRAVAEQSWTSAGFWAAARAWAYPALLKISGPANENVLVLQFVLHVGSHLFLAWALFVSVGRRGVGLALGAVVLVFGISPHLTSWTVVVLAESMAISMAAAFLGALVLFWTWLEREGLPAAAGGWLAALALVPGVLLGATRDTWPCFLLLVAAVLLASTVVPAVGGVLRSRRALAAIFAAVLVAAALLQLATARIGQRWRFGLTNVVLMQVLPDPQTRAHWVQAYGLPADADLLRVAETYVPGYQDAAFAHRPFQRWLAERGMRSYARELITHPLRTTHTVLGHHRDARDQLSWEYSECQGDRSLPARLSQRLLFHPLWIPPGLDFLAALLPCILALRYGPGPWRPAARVLLLLGAYLPFLSALGSLADPEEIFRHTLQVALGLRLLGATGLVWLVALALSRLRRARRPGTGQPTQRAGV